MMAWRLIRILVPDATSRDFITWQPSDTHAVLFNLYT